MTKIIYYGDNKFNIHVAEKGCGVVIHKNGKFYSAGQYYPDEEKLALKTSFEEERLLLENKIRDYLNIEDVEFPYIKGY